MAGKFFSVPSEVVDLITRHTSWEDALLGYIVLARYSQPKNNYITTAGAPAISHKLGITRHKADQVLATLKSVRWGDQPQEAAMVDYRTWLSASAQEPVKLKGRYPVKVLPHYGDTRIYMPNSLVDGIGQGTASPPLMQLREIQPKRDRLDAIRLLLTLYEEHSYLDYGGVNPKLAHRPWVYTGSLFDGYFELGYQGSSPTHSRTFHFWMIQKCPDPVVLGKVFVNRLMGGDERRFRQAFDHLSELYLFYEVAMVFDDDPLVNPNAEMMYPLYVWDRNIREKAKDDSSGLGGLYSHAFDRMDRSYIVEDLRGDTFSDGAARSSSGSGFYVYGADCREAKVLSVYRLKYLPHTKDTGAGIDAEKERTARWKHSFDHEPFQ
jgi:hypothetical protein